MQLTALHGAQVVPESFKNGLVLSGGGATGSFEVGVLEYLYKYQFRPNIICSTSVGSVNALKLAEGEVPATDGYILSGFQGLKQLWLNMNVNDDMYIMEPWLANSPAWLQTLAISQDLKLNVGLVGSILGLPANILNIIAALGEAGSPGLFGAVLGALPAILTGDPAIAIGTGAAAIGTGLAAASVAGDLIAIGETKAIYDVIAFAGQLKSNKSLYSLSPLEQLALSKGGINPNAIANSGIILRMSTVGLYSGGLYFTTERGELVSDPTQAKGTSFRDDNNGVIYGMLASAGIPAIFNPQNLADDWYVDGGIRKGAPVAAAINLGASIIYTVVSTIPIQANSGTPCDPTPKPDDKFDNKGILDIATRAMEDIMVDEILVDSFAPPVPWGLPHLVIRPNVQVEGSRTIDPGLIRINISYGFMRAYDVLSSQRNPWLKRSFWGYPDRNYLIELSDYIACYRCQIWALENSIRALITQFLSLRNSIAIDNAQALNPNFDQPMKTLAQAMAYGSNAQALQIKKTLYDDTVTPPAGMIAGLRALKATTLAGFVNCRLNMAGPDSVPSDAELWQLGWEVHNWTADPNDTSIFAANPGAWPPSPYAEFDLGTLPSVAIPGTTVVGNPIGTKITIPPPPSDTPSEIPNLKSPPIWEGCHQFEIGSTPQGNYIEDDYGNFNVVAVVAGRPTHFWCDNRTLAPQWPNTCVQSPYDANPNPVWHQGEDIPFPASLTMTPGYPVATDISFFQSHIASTLFPHGNLEVLVHFRDKAHIHQRFTPPGSPGPLGDWDYLATYSLDPKTGSWAGPYGIAVAEDKSITFDGLILKPSMLQLDDGTFLLMVAIGSTLKLFSRDPNQPDPTKWHMKIPDLALGLPNSVGSLLSATIFQSIANKTANRGNLEVLVNVKTTTWVSGKAPQPAKEVAINELRTYYYDWATASWHGPVTIIPTEDSEPISGVSGNPNYVQDETGQYHITAVVSGSVWHYWAQFDSVNPYPKGLWHHGIDPEITPSNLPVNAVIDSTSLFASPDMVEGKGATNLLKLLIHSTFTTLGRKGKVLTSQTSDELRTFYFDSGNSVWTERGLITVNGDSINGVEPF